MHYAIGSWAGQNMFNNLLKKRKHEEISRDPARTVSHGLVQSVDNAPRLRCYRETIQSRLYLRTQNFSEKVIGKGLVYKDLVSRSC